MASHKGGTQEVIVLVGFLVAVLIAAAFIGAFSSVIGDLP